MHSQHFGHWFPHKHGFLSPLRLHQIACFLAKQHMSEHFQCKPYIPNNRFCTGSPDPVLTLVAIVLCGLGGWQGRTMWGWHTSLLLLLGQGPASLFPPSPCTPQQLAAASICWSGAVGRLQPLVPLWVCVLDTQEGKPSPRHPKLFLCTPQVPSLGCLPLYWISLHLPTPGF